MTLRDFAAAAASVVLLAACSQQPGVVYQVPIAETREILLATDLPPLVFGSQPPEAEVRAEGGSDIIWIARRGGSELFRYAAHLSEEGADATRVTVELKGGTDEITHNLDDHPKIRDLYLVAMNERVASTLEHRDFETSRIYPALTAASMENMGSLRASADAAAAASEQMERGNIEKAYRDEAAGRR